MAGAVFVDMNPHRDSLNYLVVNRTVDYGMVVDVR